MTTAGIVQRLLVKAMIEAGYSLTDIGQAMKVTRQRIQQIAPEPSAPRRGRGPAPEPGWMKAERERYIAEIGQILEGPRYCVRRALISGRSGIDRRFNNLGIVEQIIALWNAGVDSPDIRGLLGASKNQIFAAIGKARAAGAKIRRANNRGIGDEILRLWNSGLGYRAIAEAMGVSRWSVGPTLSRARKRGKHVRSDGPGSVPEDLRPQGVDSGEQGDQATQDGPSRIESSSLA